MSLSQNLQNILDDTLNSFLFADISFNITNLDQIQPFLFNGINALNRERRDTEDSLPDLIPNEPVPEEEQEPLQEEEQEPAYIEDNRRRIRLWSNLLMDYHTQMTSYQNNIRSILTITETMLPRYNATYNYTYPVFNTPEMTLNNRFLQLLNNTNSLGNYNYGRVNATHGRANATHGRANETSGRANETSGRANATHGRANATHGRANATSGRANATHGRATSASNLANYFSGFSDGTTTATISFEPIYTRGIYDRNRNIPTALQISRATTLFTYNPQENTLISTICPITLEEFVEGESLTQIHACGHVFKTESLFRWFERNRVCPSCRHDITVA